MAANFQTSILHLLRCTRQVRAQKNDPAPHHRNKKVCSSRRRVKQTSPRHHRPRNISGGLRPGLHYIYPGECLKVWWPSPVSGSHLVWGCLLGTVHRGGVGLASSPFLLAEQGDSSSEEKTAISTEARGSRIPSAQRCASQKSTRCPSRGFCAMRSWVCHDSYQCFILNLFVILLIS